MYSLAIKVHTVLCVYMLHAVAEAEKKHKETTKSMLLLLSSSYGSLMLLASFFLTSAAQTGFVPVEWTPEAHVPSPEQCGLAITSDLSNALATVAQLMKSKDIASSLPKSCLEIKESSPVSPSGYYTISNGSGGSVVVYCNMDELYSCPSLEQTLKRFSSNLADISSTLATNSAFERIATSCKEVRDKCPECSSGYYKILVADLTEKYVYCAYEERCATAGPWTRVAHLNMSDSNSVCPNGTQKFVNGSAIACGIQEPSDAMCVSITYSIAHCYSEICGQVAGHQKGTTDAFATDQTDINGVYVDGVSITRGSPRQHVWTYAIGMQEANISVLHLCPCAANSTMQVPSFVGSDYYCESGNPGICDLTTIYSNDVLWDGEQCEILEMDCCTVPNQPWFHKVLDTPSVDDIEIRLCINQPTSDENVLVSLYDIYIQ